jgi:hypothetical protein
VNAADTSGGENRHTGDRRQSERRCHGRRSVDSPDHSGGKVTSRHLLNAITAKKPLELGRLESQGGDPAHDGRNRRDRTAFGNRRRHSFRSRPVRRNGKALCKHGAFEGDNWPTRPERIRDLGKDADRLGIEHA